MALEQDKPLLLKVPNSRCKVMPAITQCFLRINSSHADKFPKIQVNSLTFNGPNSHWCDFAGLQFMEPYGTATVGKCF